MMIPDHTSCLEGRNQITRGGGHPVDPSTLGSHGTFLHRRISGSLRMLVWFLALPILLGTIHGAELTKLTNLEGRLIEAEVIALKEGKAEILIGAKRMSYPMDQLTQESQAEVKRVLAAREGEAAEKKAARMKLPDGQDIVPGQLLSFTLQATEEDRQWAKNDQLKEILISVAFPNDFDPDKPSPVFFVNDTTPGANAKISGSYVGGGTELGYVVLGAQAVGTSHKSTLSYWDVRGVVTARAINELGANWLAITESEWYFGGSSGGSKNCCYLAVYLYERFKKPGSGFFISACNEMKMLDAIEAYKSDKQAFRKAAVFVSSGNADTVATPAQGKIVAEAFERALMGEVRFELHNGGHGMNQEHYREALKWFTRLRENPQAEPPQRK